MQIHKLMAGLLDQYTFLGDELALQMVADEAAFFHGYVEDVLKHEGRAHWVQMLEVRHLLLLFALLYTPSTDSDGLGFLRRLLNTSNGR